VLVVRTFISVFFWGFAQAVKWSGEKRRILRIRLASFDGGFVH